MKFFRIILGVCFIFITILNPLFFPVLPSFSQPEALQFTDINAGLTGGNFAAVLIMNKT